MKLYIPTTGLNIDNILSTESIAPQSFYEFRNYGYNHSYGIDAIPTENHLLLFSKKPQIKISGGEIDHFPMIVEIEVDSKSEALKCLNVGETVEIYTCNSVLYLTPWNTKCWFFNDQDLNKAKDKIDSSLNNKLGAKFKLDIFMPDFNIDSDALKKYSIEDKGDSLTEFTQKDNRHDRIKGFLFGSLLGLINSINPATSQIIKTQRQIYDIIASLKNLEGHQRDPFIAQLNSLNEKIKSLDHSREKAKELWYKETSESGIDDKVLAFFKKYGGKDENSLKRCFMSVHGLKPFPILEKSSHFSSSYLTAYNNSLQESVNALVVKEKSDRSKSFSVSCFDLDPSYDSCILSGEDAETMLFNYFLDKLIWHGELNSLEKLKIQRTDMARNFAVLTKDFWKSKGEKWEESAERKYINTFLSNIYEAVPFEINESGNIILKSFVAFILKGEDYESLMQYCESNGFSDFRYITAIWGAVNGYAQISRPIFEPALKWPKFREAYKEILHLLHNMTFSSEESENTWQETENKKGVEMQPIELEGTSEVDQEKRKQEYREAAERALKGISNKATAMASLNKALEELDETKSDYDFLRILNDFEGWTPTSRGPRKAWTLLQEHFVPDFYERLGSKASPKHVAPQAMKVDSSLDAQPSLFQDKISLAENNLWIQESAELIENTKSKSQYNIDAKWFWNNCQKTFKDKKGTGPGYFYKEGQTNATILDRFRTYLQNKKVNKGGKIPQKIVSSYEHIPINNIINYLTKKYGD